MRVPLWHAALHLALRNVLGRAPPACVERARWARAAVRAMAWRGYVNLANNLVLHGVTHDPAGIVPAVLPVINFSASTPVFHAAIGQVAG